jgi:acyl-coenzyme A synthetase/AMP-(fatty) acid ligase
MSGLGGSAVNAQPQVYGPALPADRRLGYARRGLLTPGHLRDALRRSAASRGHQAAAEFDDHGFTYAQLSDEVARVGGLLRALGARAGDRVCWQTPNWWEAYVVALACWEIRAISVPVVPGYRERELASIVAAVKPAVVVTPAEYRGHRFAEMWDSIIEADAGATVVARIVLRGDREGWTRFDAPASSRPDDATGHDTDLEEEPCLILFSSGTTAAPKAVVHCSRSLLAEAQQAIHGWGWDADDVCYIPTPLQHIAAMMFAVIVPVVLGARVIVDERWNATRALAIIRSSGVTISSGATVFLRELVEACRAAGVDALPLKAFGCGGAAIQSVVMDEAERLGMGAFRQYGMTELPTVTVMNAHYSVEQRSRTDGLIAPGVEVRVLDPVDGTGELCVRGAEQLLGYLDPDHAQAIDEDGWVHTGDIGRVDADGFVTIEGRIKDIINRGGEKFSALEVEEILSTHPAVSEAAVVAMPHARLGETGCAFVVVAGEVRDLDEQLKAFLAASGLARQKIPERFVFVDDLPRTPAGKVRKADLRKTFDPPRL